MIVRKRLLLDVLSCLVWLIWAPIPALPARASSPIEQQHWSTRPDVVVGGEPGSATALARLSTVRTDASGTRIVVRQAQRVTVWDTGSLRQPVLEFGHRADAPPVGSPRSVYPDSAGLWIRYDGGWGRFAYDGRLVSTTPHVPDTWQRTVILPDGAFLALERSPPVTREFTWDDEHPGWMRAVAHVRFAEGSWVADTLAMYDSSGRTFAVAVGGSRSFSGQPFAEHDLPYFNRRHDAAGLVERRGPGNQVRVVEIAAGNDTILDARVPVRSMPLERERAEAAIEAKMREVEGIARLSGGDTLSTTEVRAVVEDALYVPDRLQLVTAVIPTASNEVWLRSSEKADSSVVWIVLDRTDTRAPPRRVLLPDAFRLRDATRDRVWGLHVDARFSGQVQGRRLVRP